MKQLNEHTIKRLQKLAGISEIRVGKPGRHSLKIKKLTDPIRDINNENYNNHPYADVYDILIGWAAEYSGMTDDPTGEYTRNIQHSLDYLKELIEDGDGSQRIIDWVKMAENLPPNQMYIYNNGPLESFKFTTDSNGKLHASTPSGMRNDDALLSRYDDRGNLVPND